MKSDHIFSGSLNKCHVLCGTIPYPLLSCGYKKNISIMCSIMQLQQINGDMKTTVKNTKLRKLGLGMLPGKGKQCYVESGSTFFTVVLC